MSHTAPSALVTEQGTRILLRLEGRFFDIDHNQLRVALGLDDGPPGVGISIEQGRLTIEFPDDDQTIEMSAVQLQRRIAKHEKLLEAS